MLPDKMYYNIREVAAHFDVAPSLLRFWEKEFPHISPKRNAKGTRFYSKSNISDIESVYELVKNKGFTLLGAKSVLQKANKSKEKNTDLKATLIELKNFLIDLKRTINENH